jgi:hypothetical protein
VLHNTRVGHTHSAHLVRQQDSMVPVWPCMTCDAFGLIGATFKQLDLKTLIFFKRAVPISPNAWYHVVGTIRYNAAYSARCQAEARAGAARQVLQLDRAYSAQIERCLQRAHRTRRLSACWRGWRASASASRAWHGPGPPRVVKRPKRFP